MILKAIGVGDIYEIEAFARMLFPEIKLSSVLPQSNFVSVIIEEGEDTALLKATINLDGRELTLEKREKNGVDFSRALALLLNLCYYRIKGEKPQWGILTGIRPIKFYRELIGEGKTDLEACKIMEEKWGVEGETSDFALGIAHLQMPLIDSLSENGVSLYVGIPFCPSRCSYCTFVSQSVKRDGALIPQYIDTLILELKEIAKTLNKNSLKLDTVYIGGGTPTILTSQQLERLIGTLNEYFPMKDVREFTVEGGRPDTITPEKLEVLRRGGVGRISVNPQSMVQSVLDAVGREHSVLEVTDIFQLAKTYGFNINMDLIAGLPTDTFDGFCYSLDSLIKLNPQNITVHALTLKRGSRISESEHEALYETSALIKKMIAYSREKLLAAGYKPYYLYRQKGTLGNLDNTGYAKGNTEGLYNIIMMEEVQSVIAAGAGSVTRLMRGSDISRIFSLKLPLEYIKNTSRIYENLNKAGEFFENCDANSEYPSGRDGNK